MPFPTLSPRALCPRMGPDSLAWRARSCWQWLCRVCYRYRVVLGALAASWALLVAFTLTRYPPRYPHPAPP